MNVDISLPSSQWPGDGLATLEPHCDHTGAPTACVWEAFTADIPELGWETASIYHQSLPLPCLLEDL